MTVCQPGRSVRLIDVNNVPVDDVPVNNVAVNNDSHFGQRYSCSPASTGIAGKVSGAGSPVGSSSRHAEWVPAENVIGAQTDRVDQFLFLRSREATELQSLNERIQMPPHRRAVSPVGCGTLRSWIAVRVRRLRLVDDFGDLRIELLDRRCPQCGTSLGIQIRLHEIGKRTGVIDEV